jgi:hypothetical protein
MNEFKFLLEETDEWYSKETGQDETGVIMSEGCFLFIVKDLVGQ